MTVEENLSVWGSGSLYSRHKLGVLSCEGLGWL